MQTDRRFSFISSRLPADTFEVVHFSGVEEISSLYSFDILLISSNPDLSMGDMVEDVARLDFAQAGKKLRYQGLVVRFEQLHSVESYVFYQLRLAPRLWAFQLNRDSRVFLHKTVPEILKETLLDFGILSEHDFEFRLSSSYPRREYVCQFNESHFDFFSRWCEREGIYYFFEQGSYGEKLIVTDTLQAHSSLPDQPELIYQQDQSLSFSQRDQLVSKFVCEQNLVPRAVSIRDYNYRQPVLNIHSSEVGVTESGLGQVYTYGNNVKSLEEAQQIARVKSQQAAMQKNIFKGKSTSPFLRSGYNFDLKNHFSQIRNQRYLTTRVEHRGTQTAYLAAGLGTLFKGQQVEDYYHNEFTSIPGDIPFRPTCSTPRPVMPGTISATVDAQGEGKYAQLDKQGRYKIRLPFDLAGRGEGRASHWIRMAQPYAGDRHGMHFPLLKETEVLLTFIDGDVDRPLIAAAVPNADQPSIVRDSNSPTNGIRSAGGNLLLMGDREGEEFAGLISPFHSSGILLGNIKNREGSIGLSTEGEYEEFVRGAKSEVSLGVNNELVAGLSNEFYGGIKNELTAGMTYAATLGNSVELTKGNRIELGTEAITLVESSEMVGLNSVTLSGGDVGTGTGVSISDLKKRASTALWTGIAACIGAGTASAFAQDCLAPDAWLNDHKGAKVGGIISAVVAGALGVGAAIDGVMVGKIVKQFEDKLENAKAAEIKLDDSGINMKVKHAKQVNIETEYRNDSNNACRQSKILLKKENISLKSHKKNDSHCSEIEIDNSKIDLKTKQENSTVEIARGDGGNKVNISLQKDNLNLKHPNGQIIMNGSGVTAQKVGGTNPAKLTLDAGSGKLECGGSHINITNAKVDIKFGTEFEAGKTLKVSATGMVELG